MKRNSLLVLVVIFLFFILAFFFMRGVWVPVKQKITGKRTVDEVISLYGESARKELVPLFEKNKITYPPDKLTFLALKHEKRLEVWAQDAYNKNVLIRAYNIRKLSGKAGPKLREGDFQVPEGLYKIVGLNPNSSYHLSMKLNYPNAFDLAHAKAEGRKNPGSNIFIHGKAVSVGCLAMGDKTIEELFVLARDVGIENISVVISPYDPRDKELKYKEEHPVWVQELYRNISQEFLKYTKS